MAAPTVFYPNAAGISVLLRSPGGAVGRDLARRAIRVESAAKQGWMTFPPGSSRGGKPAVRTGRLRASITSALGIDTRGLFARVGSNVVYARVVEVDYDRPYLRPSLRAAA